MRLVDADALIDNICRYASPEMAWDRLDIVHKINEMPTIEERKGKWMRNVDEDVNAWWYECSECGDYPLKNAYGHDELSRWCPHCGAKMEGEQHERK